MSAGRFNLGTINELSIKAVNVALKKASKFFNMLLARIVVLEADAVEDWHVVGTDSEPAFVNSWVNYDTVTPDCSFRKHKNIVYLKGLVKSGSSGQIFTLPAGYRPAENNDFPITSNDLFGGLAIGSDGTVVAGPYDNTWVSLSGISFYVD
jgi:hypothetical protein